jgi:hypothetical protein
MITARQKIPSTDARSAANGNVRAVSVPYAIASRLLSAGTRYLIRTELEQLNERGPRYFVRWNAMLTEAWVRDRMNRRSYGLLDEEAVRAARKSNTVFVFGSGYSLNEIGAAEWNEFGRHDVFGFNHFYHQRWIPVDFQLLRGAVYAELRWRPYLTEVHRALADNPLFEDAIFLLQGEFLAQLGNQLVGYRLLPSGARIFRYRTARTPGPPTRSFRDGVRHTTGTLADVVNCAYLLGWKEIVLVGIDLYDSRHFFLGPDETLGYDAVSGTLVPAKINVRGFSADQPHNTVRSGVIDFIGEWARHLEAEGVGMSIYNPRSLLAEVLPVYNASWARSRCARAENET